MKILVVEDHPLELKLAHLVLSAGGHEVGGAEGAEQAIAAVQSDRPDLILVDLLLPGTDGLSLIRVLKGDPGTREIPVVAITSHPERFPKAAALDAGCDAYVRKPIDTRELPGQLSALARSPFPGG